jgi:hypothetical protein
MICGRMCPELGGEESLLDIMGLNFYYSNRYSGVEGDVISWINEFNDSRFRPLHQMLLDAYQRYSKPFILAETSHPGGDRLPWLQHIGEECGVCLDMGLPLWGVCWYPIIDRPDWDDLSYWHQSGFWDLDQSNKEAFGRHLHAPLVQGLQEIQERLRHHEELLFNN